MNGYHYFLFQNGYDITMQTSSVDVQVTRMFSVISKVENPTKQKADYSYQITLEGIMASDIPGFTGLLLAEKVEQYEGGKWYEVDITRGDHIVKDESGPGYILNFEITRKELPNTPAVFQKSQHLYIGNTECDLDDDEVVPINKQTNDIAEMQDRQSDYTAQFKIRKTRAMRALFELSGDPGSNTTFPYRNQTCRYIENGIEMITGGNLILDKDDDQYYYVSIYSGNLNFFKTIDKLKLTDLQLPSCSHTWDAITQAASNAADLDYIYPLLEPSDDGGINPLTDDGSRTEQFGGWVWPFVKLKAIWDEIISNAGFICEGNILTDSRFLKMTMPIVSRVLSNSLLSTYYYALTRTETHSYTSAKNVLPGGLWIIGDALFGTGVYFTRFEATYKFRISILTSIYLSAPQVYVRDVATDTELTITSTANLGFMKEVVYEGSYTALSGVSLLFIVTPCMLYYYDIAITDIQGAKIGYGFVITRIADYLPDMSQTDFIKMICNLFGLISDTNARDRRIKFWSFNELYANIPLARNWSAYLSEREDENVFKFGDYAQNNYLKYKDIDDVVPNTGMGTMQVNDDTLTYEKDVVELPIATCDEVTILTDINVSRIAFNKWNKDTSLYDPEDSIDPRIVYIKQIANTKTFGIRTLLAGGISYDTVAPKVACSLEVSFSQMVVNYAGLSRLLTQTLMRSAKLNLPVYEVAGLKHYIPIYLKQYKAYFYVNMINNYVPGQLSIIDLIKL
jgi:hypothetical protein